MAIGDRRDLPIINQSVLRQLRSSAFRSKTPVGPQTAQAITEGALADESREAIAQENIQQQAAAEKERLKESERASREDAEIRRQSIAESSRQADLQRQDLRRQRKDAEPTFFDTVLGS